MSSQTCRTCTHRPALPAPAAEGPAGEQKQTAPTQEERPFLLEHSKHTASGVPVERQVTQRWPFCGSQRLQSSTEAGPLVVRGFWPHGGLELFPVPGARDCLRGPRGPDFGTPTEKQTLVRARQQHLASRC